MSPETLERLASAPERAAAARSRAFRLFAEAFGYPDPELVEIVRAGELADALRENLETIDPTLADEVDWDALRDAGENDDLAVEYSRLFDVGVSGPPCPLYGGLYAGARMKTMEEAVRFYNYFGLSMSDHPRELPDHLTTELEFLHFLSYREVAAIHRGEDPGPFRRAQADFVERHPGRWVPRLRARLEGENPPRFFRALVDALERFLTRARSILAR